MSTSNASGKQVVGRRAAVNAYQASAHKGLQSTTASLPGLPGELGDNVYQTLVLVEKGRTQTINPAFDEKPFSSPLGFDRVTPGIVQGYSLWNVKYDLDTAILRVNRKVHREAFDIFAKNGWVSITVNVKGFSAQLQKAGFKVLTPADANYVKRPALKIQISYDVNSSEEDQFCCPTIELPELCRALSLTSEYDKAKLLLTVVERTADEAKDTTVYHQETREWELISAFTETLVTPKYLEIVGSTSAKVKEWKESFDGNTQKNEEAVMKMITDELDGSDAALEAGRWREAHDKALSCQGLIDIAIKCDVDRRRYENLVPNFPTITSQCTSNIALARLKLGDAKGAYEKCLQIGWEVLPSDCKLNAYLRKAMAAAASRHFIVADSSFKAAYKISPSHPQLRKELKAFEEQLLKETDEKKGINVNTPKLLPILQNVRNLLRS